MNNTIEEKLKEGIVTFIYQKNDGSIRKVVGTLKQDLIPTYGTDQMLRLIEAATLLKTSFTRLLADHPESADDFEPTLQLIEKAFKPFEPKPEKLGKAKNDAVQTYYDFEAKAFRAFKKDQFIDVVRWTI